MYDADPETPLTYVMGDTVYAYVLTVLIDTDEPLTQQEIADEVGVTQACISKAIRDMVEVQIVHDPDGTHGYELNEFHPATEALINLHASVFEVEDPR